MLEDRFKSHKVDEQKPMDDMECLRREGLLLADTIRQMCPAGPEREQAITWIQAAVMLANNAIARRPT